MERGCKKYILKDRNNNDWKGLLRKKNEKNEKKKKKKNSDSSNVQWKTNNDI